MDVCTVVHWITNAGVASTGLRHGGSKYHRRGIPRPGRPGGTAHSRACQVRNRPSPAHNADRVVSHRSGPPGASNPPSATITSRTRRLASGCRHAPWRPSQTLAATTTRRGAPTVAAHRDVPKPRYLILTVDHRDQRKRTTHQEAVVITAPNCASMPGTDGVAPRSGHQRTVSHGPSLSTRCRCDGPHSRPRTRGPAQPHDAVTRHRRHRRAARSSTTPPTAPRHRRHASVPAPVDAPTLTPPGRQHPAPHVESGVLLSCPGEVPPAPSRHPGKASPPRDVRPHSAPAGWGHSSCPRVGDR